MDITQTMLDRVDPAQRDAMLASSLDQDRKVGPAFAADLDPSPDELDRLLRAAKEGFPFQHYALILCAVRTGLREGELAGLQWGDIQCGKNEDDPDRCIIVQRNYDQRWSGTMLTPKNRKSRRVDMSRQLRHVIGRGVRFESGKLSKIIHGVRTIPGTSADAKKKEAAAARACLCQEHDHTFNGCDIELRQNRASFT